MFLLNVCSR